VNEWQQPSNCDTGSCLEVKTVLLMDDSTVVMVRSSTDPRTHVAFTGEEWSEFLTAVKKGEFDL
jgi:hypothetical protein